MSKFDIQCSLGYEIKQPTDFIVQILVAQHDDQVILNEKLHVSGVSPQIYTDHTGHNRFFKFSCGEEQCDILYEAQVELIMPPRDEDAMEMPISELPPDVMSYLLASRYCESDLIYRMAIRTFGNLPRGFTRVEAICEWIKQNVDYQIGTTHSATTARDVLCNRAGVCRDFAHLGIAFCRALNIPARFVVGYAEFSELPPDFHALFEAYLGGKWILFDPTKMVALEKIVRIGYGRDAKDVAFATMYGNVQMRYLKPLIMDHQEGQIPNFDQTEDYIGAKKMIRMA